MFTSRVSFLGFSSGFTSYPFLWNRPQRHSLLGLLPYKTK